MRYPILLVMGILSLGTLHAQGLIKVKNEPGAFPVVVNGKTAPICVDSSDSYLVNKSAEFLQQDIQRVTGKEPQILHQWQGAGKKLIIIGSLDKSSLIQQLVDNKKLDTAGIQHQWEDYRIQTINHPFEGIDQALVIVGSDRRGTAYGALELSQEMGVSPWYWWADVPVKTKKEVFVKSGSYTSGPSAVRYRGFFINDEAPALSGWVHENYGKFNHQFYEKVFELLLRLKANYLWPAMWGSAFNTDDTLNPIMASKYGIVMGTSHEEPMMRSTPEWKEFGKGEWNYQTNDSELRSFWREGIEKMDHHESVVTIGMRGNGDLPMTQGSNIALLEKIVKVQRQIIQEVTGKDPSETPQDWALYKEVQDYYDKGMRVPDDVTLLFSDDNWGNVRRLPSLKDSGRLGGYGIYYHFDYVGDPRNYKWLNTNPISRVWEQMHLSYQYGVKRIWVVNVGDIKPMEFPISFFLDYARNPGKYGPNSIPKYSVDWARDQFGAAHDVEIAGMLMDYTRFNGRRKPELLSPSTYSLADYREADRIVDEYNALSEKALKLYQQLPDPYKAAFYQLVLFPIEACANLNDLYVTAAKNNLYAREGRALTNEMADSVVTLFEKDSVLSHFYNKVMENGRWNHMMDQTHIGYTYWQEPRHNNMPAIKKISLPDQAAMGISIEDSKGWWPENSEPAELPAFDPYQNQSFFVEIFNRGNSSFNYSVKTRDPWLVVSAKTGKIRDQKRLLVSVNWALAPLGTRESELLISGAGSTDTVHLTLDHPKTPTKGQLDGFVETDGYLSMEAAHYSKAVNTQNISWTNIPDLGRTLSGMTVFPVTATSQKPGGESPHLEYQVFLFDTGLVHVQAYLSPTLDYSNQPEGLRYAISFDNDPPQIVNMDADNSQQAWGKSVSDNIRLMISSHQITKPGEHTLKFWMVDPEVVLQKLVVDLGGVKSSYLGAPETYHRIR